MQDVVVVDRGLEDLLVRPKGDGSARMVGSADFLHLLSGLAAAKLHLVNLAVASNLDNHLLGQGVYNGDANAVQAAGNLIRGVIELAAGVQDGHDDLERGDLLHRVHVDRDASAVIDDGDGIVTMNGDFDFGAEASHGLVDRVVDDLPHQVVQARRAGRTDVHAGTDADGLKTLKDLDLASTVFFLFRHANSLSFK